MESTRYDFHIVIKLEFHRQVFRKIFTFKISRKSIQWEPSGFMWTDRRTNGQTDMKKLSAVLQNLLKIVKTENSPMTVDMNKR